MPASSLPYTFPYTLSQVIVLGCLFVNYNQGLLQDSSPSVGSLLACSESSPRDIIFATLRIPSPTKRHTQPRPAGTAESWLAHPLLWLLGGLSMCSFGGVRSQSVRPAMSLLRREVTGAPRAGQGAAGAAAGAGPTVSAILGRGLGAAAASAEASSGLHYRSAAGATAGPD